MLPKIVYLLQDCCKDRYKNVCFQLFDESGSELSTAKCTTGVNGEPYRIGDIIEVDYNYTRNVKKLEIIFDGGEAGAIAEIFVEVGTGNIISKELIVTIKRKTEV